MLSNIKSVNREVLKVWLLQRGYIETSSNVLENDKNKYELFPITFGRRSKLSANRWSGMTTCRYDRRFINAEGILAYK